MRLELADVRCERPVPGGSSARVGPLGFSVEPGVTAILRGGTAAERNLVLHLVGLMAAPDSGELWLDGQPTSGLDDAGRAALRARHFGFVFAEPFLLSGLSVAENVAMPLFRAGDAEVEAVRAEVEALLERVGAGGLAEASAEALTPWEQQRVALARALANRPAFLLLESLDRHADAAERAAFLAVARRAAPGAAILATSSEEADGLRGDLAYRLVDGRAERETAGPALS
jgi:predicted ABC-type transport system involved in lysophospholipase L1 biosynthesis ATPase subunit